MARARIVVVVLLALLCGACGARVAPEQQSQRDMAAGAESGGAGEQHANIIDGPGASPPAATGSATPAADASSPAEIARRRDAAFGSVDNHNSAVRLHAEHPCLRTGEPQSVHVEGPPDANLALIVGYADGGPHGSMSPGRTDSRGRFTWIFIVPATAPAGLATVVATSSGAGEGNGGGSAHASFTVAGPEGC